MPAVGDQHRGAPACVMMPNTSGTMSNNPFEEPQRRMNEYTAKEIATLQARLDKKLGPEYISARPGAAGQKVHYLSADKCINLANEVFGFNGWSSSIQNIQIDFVEESQHTGKISLGLSVIVRVTLKDGTFHEDIGYGHIENCKGKAAAFEKAKKEGTTDALKRTLRNFGNVLGNCVYDKDYVSKVTKVKSAPAKWDPNDLHRHPDYAPAKKEAPPPKPSPQDDDDLPPRPIEIGRLEKPKETSTFDGDGEFGSDLFDEADFGVAANGNPDEVTLEPEPPRPAQPPTPMMRNPGAIHKPAPNIPGPMGVVTPSKPERPWDTNMAPRQAPVPAPNGRPNIPAPNDLNMGQRRPPYAPPQNYQNQVAAPLAQQQQRQQQQQQQQQQQNQNTGSMNPAVQPPVKREPTNTDMPPPSGSPSAGFFSARAVDILRDNPNAPVSASQFDPHSQSPSIRKTAGVDHSKSVPISKPMIAGASPATNHTRDFVNPSADAQRKIGVPGGGGAGGGFGSPMNKNQTTSSYRPLTRPNADPRSGPSPAVATANRASSVGPQNANGKRPPLNDVTNATSTSNSSGSPAPDAIDPKRPRINAGEPEPQPQVQAPPQQ